MRRTLGMHEHALVQVIIDSRRRYSIEVVQRKEDEDVQAFADRVRQAVIDKLTKVNS